MSSTILALDIGERKIGVARANSIARIAEPLMTLKNDHDFAASLKSLLAEQEVSQLVVGLPRGMDGQDTAQTTYVRSFVKELGSDVPVHFQDEAVTSVNAEEILKAKKRPYAKEDIDAMAATLILEDYLKESA